APRVYQNWSCMRSKSIGPFLQVNNPISKMGQALLVREGAMRLQGSKLITTAFLLAFAIVGLSAERSSAETTLEKIKRTGVFLAGVRPDYAPFGSLDNNGEPVGFGPELSKIFADKLGVQVKYVLVSSATRIPMIQNGTIDADVGLTTPTKQRNEQIDFTTPYV